MQHLNIASYFRHACEAGDWESGILLMTKTFLLFGYVYV